MELKRISFKIAKAIKEAGYPQNHYISYTSSGELISFDSHHVHDGAILYSAPTYLEVWLWLWREKETQIELQYDKHESNAWCEIADDEYKEFDSKDPEEAIIAAIEYLVDNDLIK